MQSIVLKVNGKEIPLTQFRPISSCRPFWNVESAQTLKSERGRDQDPSRIPRIGDLKSNSNQSPSRNFLPFFRYI